MKQHEAVIQVMEKNGGFATLGFLYQEVMKVHDVHWGTKTPFASIRRIVQDGRFFFKIKPGLWALLTYRGKLPRHLQIEKLLPKSKEEEFNHYYYQGLLVEIGNLKRFDTFVPNQDQNKKFLGKKLGDVCSAHHFYGFGYDHIVRRAKMVDVCWFNKRKMPHTFFEVEHSTDIQNSLLKFMDLQDFNTEFMIVANKARLREYEHKMNFSAFEPIKDRVQFMDYDDLSDWHTKTHELNVFENKLRR
jgi:hypothetical protein